MIRITRLVSITLASVVLAGIVLMTVADVVMRYFFNRPLAASYEAGELMMVTIIWLALGYTQSERAHVRVDVLTTHLSPRVQAAVDFAGTVVALVVFILLIWQSAIFAIHTYKIGLVSDVLRIPVFPFTLVVPVGAFLLCVELSLKLGPSLQRLRGRGL